MLGRVGDAGAARRDDLIDAIVTEVGAPVTLAGWMADHAASVFPGAAVVLEEYSFVRPAASADVPMTPLGIAGLITPRTAMRGRSAASWPR